MNNSLFRLKVLTFVLLGMNHQVFAQDEVVNLELYLPQENNYYWSYVGEFESDDASGRVNVRREVASTSIIDDKRTFRVNEEVIAGTDQSIVDHPALNMIRFTTTHNGWRVFAEEQNNQILHYNHSALVLPKRVSVGDSHKYKTRLDPDYGAYGMISYHSVVVGFEELEIANGRMLALKINQEKRTKIASDERLQNVTRRDSEYTSYWLAEGLGIIKQETMSSGLDGASSSSNEFTLELLASNLVENYLWPEAELADDGWREIDWFGNVSDRFFPWIFHEDHGWLFVDAEDSSEIRLWSSSLGWWITSEELYPTLFSLDLDDWLTFNTDSTVERQFVRTDGTIVTASTNGFRFRPQSSLPPGETIASQHGSGENEYVDSRGNRYTDTGGGISPDQGAFPEVEILSPFAGTRVGEGERFMILADAFDQDGVITQVKILVNGRIIEIVEQAPYQTTFTTEPDTEVYEIYAIAIDNHGNSTQSSSVTVNVDLEDREEPNVRIASPMNRTHYATGRRVYVDVRASDGDGFVEAVWFLVDGIQVGDEDTLPPYSFNFIPPMNGTYQLSAVARDDDDQEVESQSITITVNETGIPDANSNEYPEVRISSPLNRSVFNQGDTITIHAAAQDSDGSIARVRIFVDGIQIGGDLHSEPYSVNYTPPATGSYNISARAEDNRGDETNSSSITIAVQ